jgi:hypothetical protein
VSSVASYTLDLPSGLIPVSPAEPGTDEDISSPLNATSPVHLILFDLIILTIFAEKCTFSPASNYVIPLAMSILFSKPVTVYLSLRVKDQAIN